MHTDLLMRRRLLQITFARYVKADRDWLSAEDEARSWFPKGSRPTLPMIGAPGSRLRQIWLRREHALDQLLTARRKFEEARRRLEARSRRRVLLLAAR